MASTAYGTVVAYFTSETKAEEAVSALKAAGFSSNQIGVALSSQTAAGDGTASSTAAHLSGDTMGAKAGSAWDRFKAFFDGSDVEPYADEKTTDTRSHEITAGSAYDDEDFSHSLSGLDVAEDRSRYFGHRIGSRQGAVVTVSAQGRESEAEDILAEHGGDLGSDAANYDYSAPTTVGQQKLQLLGEVLRVQKDRISRGEVRIRKEVVTEHQTVQVPVTREELVIERVPVSGTAVVAGEIGADSEIRIPLSEEVASLDKHTVVREEIAIGKRHIEDVQEVAGSVRHEELNVDETVAANAGGVKVADRTF